MHVCMNLNATYIREILLSNTTFHPDMCFVCNYAQYQCIKPTQCRYHVFMVEEKLEAVFLRKIILCRSTF
jgi:hypothetical protein